MSLCSRWGFGPFIGPLAIMAQKGQKGSKMTKMSGVLATLSKRPTDYYHQLWQNPKKGCFLVILACFGPFGPECQKGSKWPKGPIWYPITPWYGPCPGQGCSGVLIGERGQKGSKGVISGCTGPYTILLPPGMGHALARGAQMAQKGSK